MNYNYDGKEPCCRCVHKKVCGAKRCLNEIQYSTSHPYFTIEVKCTEYYNERLATMIERQMGVNADERDT